VKEEEGEGRGSSPSAKAVGGAAAAAIRGDDRWIELFALWERRLALQRRASAVCVADREGDAAGESVAMVKGG
jgi:hypothetical protein